MIREFDYYRRGPSMRGAATVLATLMGVAAWLAGAPVLAQEKAAPQNVTVDYGVLDRLGTSNSEAAPLPPPAEKPVSHVVTSGSSSSLSPLGGPTPPDVVPEGTALSVPTTPMEATTLGDAAVPSPGGTTTDLSPGGAVGGSEPLPPPPTPAGEPAAASADTAGTAPAAAGPSGTPPTQSASVEPAAGTQPPDAADQSTLIDGQLRIPYDRGTRGIPEAAMGKIDALIEKLHGEPSMRLQVLAYAEGDSDEVTRSRGLSLSRALAMRSYLVEHGIDMTRMDVRALGNTAQEEPADRVDLIPVPQ
jgi:outer membrane protein OmpA-like peptidoglycan-associated protein